VAPGGPRRGEIRQFWRTFSRNQLAMCGGAVVTVLVFLAVLAPALAPWDPNRPDTRKILVAPSSSHWFGTDPLGRDVLSRVLYGSRISLSVGFVSIADYGILPPALKRFRASFPLVEVQLHELTTDAQIRELRATRLDLGIALAPVDEPDLEFERLLREELVIPCQRKCQRPTRHPFRFLDRAEGRAFTCVIHRPHFR